MGQNNLKLKPRIIFIVVGRLGKSLTQSKVLPIVASQKFDKVIVFREEIGYHIDGVEYITLDCLKNVKRASLKSLLRHIIEPIQLIYYSIRFRPILINGYQLLPKGIYSFIAAKISFSKSMISSIGGIPEIDTYSRHKWFFKRINLFVLKHADIITTKGDTVSSYIIKHGVNNRKVFTFNGAINTKVFFWNKSILKSIDIMFIGNYSNLKGPDRFVNIIKILVVERPELKSIIVGDGPLFADVNKMIMDYGLGNNISQLGYQENTADLFKQSKIIIMPSTSEGLATSMLEAMACGCVPIVSNVGCMNEAAKQNVNALLVEDYNDIDGFVENARICLKDEKQLYRLAENGSALVYDKYSVEAQGEIFKQIVSNHM